MSRKQRRRGPITATVGKILPGYFVVYLRKSYGRTTTNDAITVSLSNWEGESPPKLRQVVEIEGVALFHSGWRAQKARAITLELASTKQDARGSR